MIDRASLLAGGAGLLAAMLAPAAASALPTGSLTVGADANLFLAGTPASGGGATPVEVMLAGEASVRFSSVTGLTNCCSGTPATNADGTTGISFGGSTDVASSGGVSGIVASGRQLFLAGLFTDSSAPPSGTAPARLGYGGSGTSYELESYAPLLNQTFFIGDGLTGTGGGSMQAFLVPSGADTLWLGFIDAGAFVGTPGFYTDNTGALEVTFAPSAAVPGPAALPLAAAALGMLGLLGARRRA